MTRGWTVCDQLPTINDRLSLFYRRLIWCLQECQPATEESIEQLLSAIDERRHITLLNAFESIYEQKLGIYQQLTIGDVMMNNLPSNCVMIRKVCSICLSS